MVDQIDRLRSELKEGTFLENAQRRSQRRKSAWNLLLPVLALPLWLLFTFIGAALFWSLHVIIHSEHTSLRVFWHGGLDLARLLILIPTLLAAVPPALVVTNFLVYLVPPARRAMEEEDRGYSGVDYGSSQRALLKLSAAGLAIAVLLGSTGAAMNVTLH